MLSCKKVLLGLPKNGYFYLKWAYSCAKCTSNIPFEVFFRGLQKFFQVNDLLNNIDNQSIIMVFSCKKVLYIN